MVKRIYYHYKRYPVLQKLAVSFLINWVIWFLASWLIGDNFFFDAKHTVSFHVFNATWMAAFTTLFNWITFKSPKK